MTKTKSLHWICLRRFINSQLNGFTGIRNDQDTHGVKNLQSCKIHYSGRVWRREISLCERWKLRRWVEAVWRKKRLQGCIRRINYTLQRFAYCLKNVRLHIPIDYQWKCKRLSCVIVAIGRSIDQIYLYFTFRDTKFGEAHGQAQSLQYLIIRIQTMTPPWRHHDATMTPPSGGVMVSLVYTLKPRNSMTRPSNISSVSPSPWSVDRVTQLKPAYAGEAQRVQSVHITWPKIGPYQITPWECTNWWKVLFD